MSEHAVVEIGKLYKNECNPSRFSMILYTLVLLTSVLPASFAALVDLTASNRRPPVPGLPDWTQVGYEKGLKPLPGDLLVGRTITSAQLASQYGVVADDGNDDSDGLQRAIQENPGSDNSFTVIQLPKGTINLSKTVYLSSNYLILRGAGNDPSSGTVISFSPDENTKYDVLSANGANWDLDGMSFHWDYREPADTPSGMKEVIGDASSGWLWPGRSIFRVGSMGIAPKYTIPASLAPANRLDFFYGTMNYHWRNDTKIKGYMADQTKEIAGFSGTRKIYIDAQNSSWGAHPGSDVWVAVPARSFDYDSWQVQNKDYYQNQFIYQDWFTVVNSAEDDDGSYIEVDHDLAFDVYTSSVAGGSPQMQEETTYAKVMPIDDPVHHVGIENLYMTQPMPSLNVADAVHNYGNMAPESAMHGVVFRYARDSWMRDVRTYMTGSHPIATEAARYIQIQDNFFEGSWNKGAGGNGYVRGSRVWDSLYYNNTLRDLRHFTFQWCAMRNVATMQNMTNDMNMHGGYEGHNLLELNYVSVPFEHSAAHCKSNCGGEGGANEGGTWAPIYWSTGSKASKWSGATGPQNVFYRNYMIKAFTAGSNQVEYQPYFAKDGSLSKHVWQFGWDRQSPLGTRYQHLSLDGGPTLLDDWQGHEQDRFMDDPAVGVNGEITDVHSSLFFRDVSNGTGITTFDSIAGYAYCLGKVPAKVVGYYLGSAATRECLPWGIDGIDHTAYSHILYAYATLGTDGTVSLTASQQTQVKQLVALKKASPGLKVFIAVGGWGLGVDATGLATIAGSASGRTKFGTTALALLNSVGADGIDLEWTPCVGAKCVTAAQFSTIASAVKTGIGSKLLSLSTSSDFWLLSGVNKVTINLASIVEFITIFTHQKAASATQDANDPVLIQATLARAQTAGMSPTKLLFGTPFYSRPLGSSSLQSSCIRSSDLSQGTFPYYAVDSLLNGYVYENTGIDFTAQAIDEVSLITSMAMNDGSTMFSETPWSVAARARLSQDLCMGGISVFSIDQDNAISELTRAIYSPGGLLPTHDEIVATLDVVALGSDGYLRDGALNGVANQLISDYPFLDAVDQYRILLLGALEIQSKISLRLQSLLSEKALTADDFRVYKTWETRATQFQLANATGMGNQYWHCTGDGRPLDKCPGGFVPDNSIFGNAHLTEYLRVEWVLDDEAGYRQYLDQTYGINLDTLVTGSWNVTRPVEICNPSRACGPNTSFACNGSVETAESKGLETSSATPHRGSPHRRRGSHHRIAHILANGTHEYARFYSIPSFLFSNVHSHFRRFSKRDDGDPFDPPANCHTVWDGLRVIDPDTYFANPADIIKTYIATTDSALRTFRSLAFMLDAVPTDVFGLLETTLTSISLGNQTIGNTEQYLQQVAWAEAQQASFDQAHARVSVGKIIENIFLGLLSFIPGVGEISDLVLGGIDAFGIVSKLMDVASLAETLNKDSGIFKLIAGGLTTGEEIAAAARGVDEILVETEAFATRARLGEGVLNVQSKLFTCAIDSLGPFVMDNLADVGGSIPGPNSRRKSSNLPRSNPLKTVVREPSADKLHSLDKRAFGNPCILRITSAKPLKVSSEEYTAHCEANNFDMEIPNTPISPTSLITDSFENCRALHQGMCQCDHLFEPSEVAKMIKKVQISGPELTDLCKALPDSFEQVKEVLNGQENLAGLFGDNKSKGNFNPNSIKYNLLDSYQGNNIETARAKYQDEGRNLMYDVAARHIERFAPQRQATASLLDDLFHSWHEEIQRTGTDSQKRAFAKYYTPNPDGTKRDLFLQVSKDHEAHCASVIERISTRPDASNTGESDEDSAGDSDESKRAGKKRALTPEDVECNEDRAKRART